MNRHDRTVSIGEDSTHLVAPMGRAPHGRSDEVAEGQLLGQLLLRPELARDRSFVIQRAVDEFQQLSIANPALTPDDYCRRFDGLNSSLKSSIYRQLEVEQFVNTNPWLKAKLEREPWPIPGEQRGSFHVIEEIGRGGLSRVFLCSQPELGHRQVIIKMSSSSLCEADSLGRLRHPGIVPIHSVERDDTSGLHMLCMPFLGRSTLYDLLEEICEPDTSPVQKLRRAARVWEQPSDRTDESRHRVVFPKQPALQHHIAGVGEQLASALAHAHAQGVYHGDVKPSNILLASDGAPLLMDFNLSGNIALSLAAKGGTLPYMPPEQLRVVALADGSAAQYDRRSDIYSLGAVLYEALAGRVPFSIDDVRGGQIQIAKQLLEHQQSGPAPIRSLASEVPPSLAEIIESCLRYHPSDRIQQADELAALLRSETSHYKLLRWRLSSNRRRVALAGAALFSILLASVVYLAQRPPRHERLLHAAVHHRELKNYAAAEDALREAIKERPSYPEAQFELARTALAEKSYGAAHEALNRLEEMSPDARSAAYKGYCFNLEQRHDAAIPCYLMAMERGGDTLEVLNNLGYSYMHGRSLLGVKRGRSDAYERLTSALALRPKCPSVQLNWIALAIERNQMDGVPMPDDLPEISSQLVTSNPNCGHCFERAAFALALMSPVTPERLDQGVAYLIRAFELGHGPDARLLQSRGPWSLYRDDARLRPILTTLAERPPTRRGDRLSPIMEPLSLAHLEAND
jgi:eukaryotic-like serine/threonine-protein kinase